MTADNEFVKDALQLAWDYDGLAEKFEQATALIRRMAERFDGASNGKCNWCRAGRKSGVWEFSYDGRTISQADECSNRVCRSHDIRTFILNAER